MTQRCDGPHRKASKRLHVDHLDRNTDLFELLRGLSDYNSTHRTVSDDGDIVHQSRKYFGPDPSGTSEISLILSGILSFQPVAIEALNDQSGVVRLEHSIIETSGLGHISRNQYIDASSDCSKSFQLASQNAKRLLICGHVVLIIRGAF